MSKALLIALAAATLVHAQSERGNIVGVVTDGTGANMPNVAVTIVNKSTNISTHILTTSSGEYTAPNLSHGEYRIEIRIKSAAVGPNSSIEDRELLTQAVRQNAACRARDHHDVGGTNR